MKRKLFILFGLILFLASISLEVRYLHAAWLSGYGYRKKITIQGTNLDVNQTHFPVLISVVDGDIDDHCDDDGIGSWDIMFTQSDGTTELDIDWVDYSEAGGNATIICFVSDAGWGILANGSTELYLYYGNASEGDPGTSEGVWDASFEAVWHFMEASLNLLDSTSNDRDITVSVGDPTFQQSGCYFYGVDIDEYDVLRLTNGCELTIKDPGAIEFWYDETDSISTWARWLEGEVGDETDIRWKRLAAGGDEMEIWIGTFQNQMDTGIDVTDGALHHMVTYWDGTLASGSREHYVHIDGAQRDGVNNENGAVPAMTGIDLNIGNNDNSNSGCEGIISEVRIHSSKRSDAWFKFTYYNINEADQELTWAAEEAAGGTYTPRVIIMADGFEND